MRSTLNKIEKGKWTSQDLGGCGVLAGVEMSLRVFAALSGLGGQGSNVTVSLKMIYDPKWQKNRANTYLHLLTLCTDSQESPANSVKFIVKSHQVLNAFPN